MALRTLEPELVMLPVSGTSCKRTQTLPCETEMIRETIHTLNGSGARTLLGHDGTPRDACFAAPLRSCSSILMSCVLVILVINKKRTAPVSWNLAPCHGHVLSGQELQRRDPLASEVRALFRLRAPYLAPAAVLPMTVNLMRFLC